MTKTLITALMLTGASLAATAQYTFSFDDGKIPAAWTAENGTLSLSTDHYTDGTSSLCWEVPAGQKSSITVSFDEFATSSLSGAYFDIYSYSPTNTPLLVEFLNSSKSQQLKANVTINFKGWRQFFRKYTADFGTTAKKNLAYVRLTLDNTPSTEPQKLFFDSADFKYSGTNRVATELMINDMTQFAANLRPLLTLYAFPADIELAEPTAQEIADIQTIRAFYPYKPQGPDTPRLLNDVRTYIKNLGITRNADGTVKGAQIYDKATVLTAAMQTELLTRLNNIASSSTDADKALFNDFLDLVIDQGIMYRFPQMPSNTYNIVRTNPKLLFNLLSACNDEQYDQVLKMAGWVSEAGWAYATTSHLSTEFSCDIIYNYMTHFISYAAYQRDPKIAARELKAMSRFLERVLTPVRGGYDTIKPDWTGFHHGTHYNNYMYCYLGWIDAAYNLKGTAFKVSPTAYSNMKNAVLATYKMSNRSSSGSNIYANSLAGRHPFDGGQINQVKKGYFERLIEIGLDSTGSEDTELEAAYNYFLLDKKYNVSEADYTGFYQFNYSPIGVYRGDDWVVTMRAPTTRCWGAEIYSGTSRFSRYQSHGTMEVVYSGKSDNSGHPAQPRGYDWNVCPGGTTVHFTDWNEMMPKSSTTQRFDQFTKTKNFSGALAWDKFGMWACDFDQIDTWGSECFTPTNLEFKKSVYAFDGMLISLGSNIKSSGSYSDARLTATNLFQEVGDNMGALAINGQDMAAGSAERTIDANTDTWFVTPKGTGYFVPKGNDAITVKYAEQEGPDEDGSDVASPSKAMATKAYINHGSKASNAKYEFVMVPAMNTEKMAELAAKLTNDADDVYTILSQNDKFHALTYKPTGVTAYAFFGAVPQTGLSTAVYATGSEMLVMEQKQPDGALFLAVCNPNMRPQARSTALGDWMTGETVTTLTLNGEWYTDQDTEGLTVNAPADGRTTINLTLNDGLPIYIKVGAKGYHYDGVNTPENTEWLSTHRTADGMAISLTEARSIDTEAVLYTIDGREAVRTTIKAGQTDAILAMPRTSAPYILRVAADKVYTAKCF